MLVGATTGVGTYARELRIAQQALAERALLVEDGGVASGRFGRWLQAVWPGARRAAIAGERLVSADVFRRAQVHFDIYGRPLALRVAGPAGIVHFSYPVPIRIVGWRNLYTVHDAIPLTHPDLTPIDGARHRRLLAAVAREAAGIVTVSASAKAEIVAATGWAEDFVHDCSEAVAPERSDAALPEGLAAGGYVVAVGTVETRKNLAALIDGHRASGVRLPLVIAGPDGAGAEGLADRLGQAGVVRLPYLDAPVLRALIQNARALAMVSLAEGFGLPVVEAMALGVPVIASDRGALAEVAGGAALLVDPADTGAIGAAIGRVAGDDALCAGLVERGLANARRFSREVFAERLGEVYGRLA